ncbi:hypothetical protein XENTR_v10012863 [Xenopus tropicalis]|nr:hypothetical protein XENTR_v10012863 [Xenopus tropicalis]
MFFSNVNSDCNYIYSHLFIRGYSVAFFGLAHTLPQYDCQDLMSPTQENRNVFIHQGVFGIFLYTESYSTSKSFLSYGRIAGHDWQGSSK